MKKLVLLGIVVVLLGVFGCSLDKLFGSDDEDNSDVTVSLSSPTDKASDQDTSITFSWSGTASTYDVYLGTISSSLSKIVSDLTSNSYTKSGLSAGTTYYWKVIGKKDSKTAESSVRSFMTKNIDLTGINWSQITSGANWTSRAGFASVIFDNKIWIMGGYKFSERYNDVWYSEDGVTWIEVTTNAAWSGREGLCALSFEGKLWIIGGGGKNDVWYSEDGKSWIEATSSAPWAARSYHTCVVYQNEMWVIGGSTSFSDVWHSADGINWTQTTANAEWSSRVKHTSVVFDGKMWLIGGWSEWANGGWKNDVWFSQDGKSWFLATNSGDFSARSNHTSVTYNNKIWVMGGGCNSGSSEVWSSLDGKSWEKVTSSAPWNRWIHQSVVFDNRIWILGGCGFYNDVWSTTK